MQLTYSSVQGRAFEFCVWSLGNARSQAPGLRVAALPASPVLRGALPSLAFSHLGTQGSWGPGPGTQGMPAVGRGAVPLNSRSNSNASSVSRTGFPGLFTSLPSFEPLSSDLLGSSRPYFYTHRAAAETEQPGGEVTCPDGTPGTPAPFPAGCPRVEGSRGPEAWQHEDCVHLPAGCERH